MTLKRKNILARTLRFFLFNCAATLIVVSLRATLYGSSALSFENVFGSFVYSNCIGTLTGGAVVFGVPAWREYKSFFRFAFLATAILTTSVLGVMAADLLLYAMNVGDSARIFAPNGQTFLFAFVIAFGFGFSAYVYELSQAGLVKTREQLKQREVDVAQAETLATEAQLASLESRLQPHFLFNTLNSIAALIREDPELAEETVEKLARLLRYSLEVNNERQVEFSQELKITLDYLEIERVRFGARLEFYVEVAEQSGTIQIPPFTLQTLVENSIKHVAAKRSGAVKIWISARRGGNFFELAVRDDGAGFTTKNIIEGHGLDTLQKRLSKIFAGDFAFEIPENGKGGCVQVHIPLTFKK